jgi:membrane-anchored protein YejM (alkaline phosphatase superfamily)
MSLLFVIYLVSSIVPTFLILDATLKTSLSLVLLDGIISSEIVLMVNLMMWIFNFGLPAFVGNLLILSPKQSSLQPKKAL